MTEAESKLKSVLGEFFRDNFYSEGIKNLRKSLSENSSYRESWQDIVWLIVNKEMEEGVPIKLIHNTANLPLDENTDEEAYKWLNLMLINSLGSKDSMIIEY